jgi:hypothetical protein
MTFAVHRRFVPYAALRSGFPRVSISCLRLSGVGLLCLLPACSTFQSDRSITGSGRLVTKVCEQTGFRRVTAGSVFEVTLRRAATWGVAITADDNLVDYIRVTQSWDSLRIGLEPNLSIRNGTLKAEVTLPDLAGVRLSGAARGTIAGFGSGGSLELELSGASSLTGAITNGGAQVWTSGASHVDLQGGAHNLNVRSSGASHVNLAGYGSADTRVEASGASHVRVNPHGKLDVEASGASSVRYVGTPTSVNSHTSGASSVQRN